MNIQNIVFCILFFVFVFLNFLITKPSSLQFGMQHFAKIVLYFDHLTWLPALSLWSLAIFSIPKSIYVLDFK